MTAAEAAAPAEGDVGPDSVPDSPSMEMLLHSDVVGDAAACLGSVTDMP